MGLLSQALLESCVMYIVLYAYLGVSWRMCMEVELRVDCHHHSMPFIEVFSYRGLFK